MTEKDLLTGAIEPSLTRRRWQQDAAPGEVGEVMTRDPHTVRPDADVADGARVFTVMSWKALPVVRDGGLVGLISRSDVVLALSRDDVAVRHDVLRLWASTGHGDWQVEVTDGVAQVRGPQGAEEEAEATRTARSVVGVRRVRHATVDRP